MHVQAGFGIDTNIGNRLAVHGEATLADSLQRTVVDSATALSTSTQSVPWVVQALRAGFTWSITTETSLIVEYAYNGLGFAGSDYTNVIQYAQNRKNGTTAPDVLGQFGSFSAAQNYGFLRLAHTITDQLTAQGSGTSQPAGSVRHRRCRPDDDRGRLGPERFLHQYLGRKRD